MFPHPQSTQRLAELRQQELLAEAERARLVAQARPATSAFRSFAAAAAWRLGALLIGLGERLRGAPVRQAPTEAAAGLDAVR